MSGRSAEDAFANPQIPKQVAQFRLPEVVPLRIPEQKSRECSVDRNRDQEPLRRLILFHWFHSQVVKHLILVMCGSVELDTGSAVSDAERPVRRAEFDRLSVRELLSVLGRLGSACGEECIPVAVGVR